MNNLFSKEKLPNSDFFASFEQLQLFQNVAEGNNIVVEAGPGTGKTSTSMAVIQNFSHMRILYLVFNNHSAVEAREMFQNISNVDVFTVNAFCARRAREKSFGVKDFRQIGKEVGLGVNSHKSDFIINQNYPEINKFDRAFIRRIIYHCMNLAIRPEEMGNYFLENFSYEEVLEYFENKLGIPSWNKTSPGELIEQSSEVLQQMVDMQEYLTVQEQLYFAFYYPEILEGIENEYDLLIVDEVQDSNYLQLKLYERFGNTQKLFIGDKNQALYAFRGSDSRVFPTLQEFCVTLPLSNCFRTPQVPLEWINQKFAHQNLNYTKEGGEIFHKGEFHFMENLNELKKPGTMLIYRSNANLLKWLLEALREDKFRFNFNGRTSIKDELTSIIKTCDRRRNWGLDNIKKFVFGRLKQDLQRAEQYQYDQRIIQLTDLRDCFQLLVDMKDTLNIQDTDTLLKVVGKLMPDGGYTTDPSVPMMCTAHGSKGLQRPHVWIINDSYKTNSPKIKNEDDRVTELNCHFVSATRAQETLHVFETTGAN